jgi:hypothetical protein
MTADPWQRAAMTLAMRDPGARREWMRQAAAECERRLRTGTSVGGSPLDPHSRRKLAEALETCRRVSR